MISIVDAMILFPLLQFFGALGCWRATREASALVMMIGFIPALIGIPIMRWGYIFYEEQPANSQFPSTEQMDLLMAYNQFQQVSSLIAYLAFLVFAWKLRAYAAKRT